MPRSARMVVVAALAALAKANEPAELLHEKEDEKVQGNTLERLQDEMTSLTGRLDRDQEMSNQMMESLKYEEESKSAGTVSLFETVERPGYTTYTREQAEEKAEVKTLKQEIKQLEPLPERHVQEDATQAENTMKGPHFVDMPEDIKAEADSLYAIMLASASGGSLDAPNGAKLSSFGDHLLSKMKSAEASEKASLNRLKAETHNMKVQEQLSTKTGAKVESELKSLEHMSITISKENSEPKANSGSLAEFVSSPRSLRLLVAVAGCSVAIALVAGIEAVRRRLSVRMAELNVPLVHV